MSLASFLSRYTLPRGISAVQCNVGIDFAVQIVVMQPMNHAIAHHRHAADRSDEAADRIVEPARPYKPVVRGVVCQHEQRVLLGSDQEHGGQHDPPREVRPGDAEHE